LGIARGVKKDPSGWYLTSEHPLSGPFVGKVGPGAPVLAKWRGRPRPGADRIFWIIPGSAGR